MSGTWGLRLRMAVFVSTLPIAAFALVGVDPLSDGTIGPSNGSSQNEQSPSGGGLGVNSVLSSIPVSPPEGSTDDSPVFGPPLPAQNPLLFAGGTTIETWTTNPTESLQALTALIYDSGQQPGSMFSGDPWNNNDDPSVNNASYNDPGSNSGFGFGGFSFGGTNKNG